MTEQHSGLSSAEVLEIEDSRGFLSALQEILEAETLAIAKEDPYPGQTQFTPLEPEHLIQFSAQDRSAYLDLVLRVVEESRHEYDQALKLVSEQVKAGRGIDGGEDYDATTVTFFHYLSEVYAERSKVKNEQAKKVAAERIFKQLLKDLPYFRAASARLGLDTSNAAEALEKAIQSVGGRVFKLIEVEKASSDGEERGRVIGFDFKKKQPQNFVSNKPEPAVDEEESVLALEVDTIKGHCRNFIDAREYREMLISPFSANSEMLMAQIGENVGLSNLAERLNGQNIRFIQDPSLIHGLQPEQLLRHLAVITLIRDRADLINSYERQVNQQAFSIYCDNLVRYFLSIFQSGEELAKAQGMYEDIKAIPYTLKEVLA